MLNALNCLGDLVRDPLIDHKSMTLPTTTTTQVKTSTSIDTTTTKATPKRQPRGRVTRLEASLDSKKTDDKSLSSKLGSKSKPSSSLESPTAKRRRVLVEMRDVALSQGFRVPELQTRSFDLEARWSQWEEDRDDEEYDEDDEEGVEGRSRKGSFGGPDPSLG